MRDFNVRNQAEEASNRWDIVWLQKLEEETTRLIMGMKEELLIACEEPNEVDIIESREILDMYKETLSFIKASKRKVNLTLTK